MKTEARPPLSPPYYSIRKMRDLRVVSARGRAAHELGADDVEYLVSRLSSATFNATKMLSFFAGSGWSTDHPKAVLEDGLDGYRRVAALYGISDEADRKGVETGRAELIAELRPLINGPRAPNRTLIHELLRKWRSTGELFLKEIDALTEQVTMGEMDWDSYCERVGAILDYYDRSSDPL